MTAVVGFVSPSVLRVPVPIAAEMPAGVHVVATGLNVLRHQPEEFERLSKELERAARALAAEGACSVLVSAVPHALHLGADEERRLYERIEDSAGVRMRSGAATMVDAATADGAERVLVVAAYSAAVNSGWTPYLEAHGVHAVDVATLGAGGPAASARLSAADYVEAAMTSAATSGPFDAVLLGVRSTPLAVSEAVASATGVAAHTVLRAGAAALLSDVAELGAGDLVTKGSN